MAFFPVAVDVEFEAAETVEFEVAATVEFEAAEASAPFAFFPAFAVAVVLAATAVSVSLARNCKPDAESIGSKTYPQHFPS